MDPELKAAIENINKISSDLTETRTRLDKSEKDRVGAGELKAAEDRIVTALTAQLVKRQDLEALAAKVDLINVRKETTKNHFSRFNVDPDKHTTAITDFILHANEMSDESRAFFASPEYRSLSEVVDTKGGFLVLPPAMEAEIVKNVVDMSPLRTVARTTVITGKSYIINKRTSGPTSTWEGEAGTGTSSESTYARVEIPVHAQMVLTRASIDSLDDIPGFENEIAMDAEEALADAEGAAFISGNGVGKPRGVVTDVGVANTGFATVTGSDTTGHYPSSDDFYSLMVKIAPKYWRGAYFLMNRTTLGRVLKLKASTAGTYIWQPSLVVGAQPTIAGFPYAIMEDIATPTGSANQYPIYFGDWTRAYRIVDRLGMQLTRDPFSAKPSIDFMYRRRIGGGKVDLEAATILITG